ncbi:hypothetical protein GOP47_0004273 [Adiantum capillus-veneris]|uniref:arginine--tRNA ligase n=1 Tax=Adiantum capillus-veneris TaxID=13818 RepID=A0A9D4V775_ADICA|nr:hypothetical protein GOP47_0004273 [Adiantum capillus-veneris]
MVDYLSLLDGLSKQGISVSGIQSAGLQHLALCRTWLTFRRISQVRFSKRAVFSGRGLQVLAGDSGPAEAAIGKEMTTSGGCVPARQQLATLVKDALGSLFPEDAGMEPLVAACTNKFGDYQCNNAMGIWSKIKGKSSEFKSPNAVGQGIAKALPSSPLIEKTSVAGPGFINIIVSSRWMEERIHKMLIDGLGSWAPSLGLKRAVVDFSSPNIAKEMHVGHLRSTIIGDSIAKMLEYCNVEVLRRNHVGDWGTQFGMLIEYLFNEYPNWDQNSEEHAVDKLQALYKSSKKRFDEDPLFKKQAQQAVVLLQGGDKRYREAWEQICSISRNEFDQVYNRLRVVLEEKGESFYNPYIPSVIKELESKGLVSESEGARVIHVEGQNIPLIVVKTDGGFNYASTDLTALWYRLNVEKADWIVYVTDVGQSLHFEMVFYAARRAGWLAADVKQLPKATHVGFGLVLGPDGKRFRTRATEVVRLADLLDEAKSRSEQGLVDRGREDIWEADELEQAAEALGYGAVKYADLKNNRTTNYTFNFDQMLDVRGNTAVYLLYAHARICSIIRKSGKDIDELKKIGSLRLAHENERLLGLHLIRFPEIIEDALADLLPNTVCEYLYNLSEIFTKFYSTCKVIGSSEETSRLLLCEAAAVIMRECFELLGITPLYRL